MNFDLRISILFAKAKDIMKKFPLTGYLDDGRPFDPVKWLELNHPDDPLKGAGIRIVVGMAKEVRYMPAMGLNNLLIIL